MNLDGLDAAVLIETPPTSPLLFLTEQIDGPTLQDALGAIRDTPASNTELSQVVAGEHTDLGDIGITTLRPLNPDEILLLAGGNGSEFTVWGPDPWWDPGLPNDPDPDGPYGNNGGGSGGTPDPFEDRVTIDASVPADQMSRAHQAELQLQADMQDMDARIQSLPNNAHFVIGNTTYTGAQIKEAWGSLNFVITWGNNFGPVGSAANYNGTVRMNLSDVEHRILNYGSPIYYGMDDTFMHELSHILPGNVAYQQSQWISYLQSGGSPNDLVAWQNSVYFQDTERFANSVALVIGPSVGVPGYTQ